MIKIALITFGSVFAVFLYTAWLNRLFLRCPYCRKMGTWRFDPAAAEVVEKDKDGNLVSTSQILLCRKCRQRVLHKWSDNEGRTLEKMD